LVQAAGECAEQDQAIASNINYELFPVKAQILPAKDLFDIDEFMFSTSNCTG